jgi:lysophospholipase L1-like esterase
MHLTRRFGSGLVAVVAATLLACGGSAPGATASSSASLGAPAPAYLALGDSVAFGFNPLLIPPKTPNFFVGYPTFLGEIVDTPMVNGACPGQTSSGFLSFPPVGSDNGCFTFRSQFDLHVEYDGTQVAFAEQFLMGHQRTWLVTLQLGANDLFLLQHQCNDSCNDSCKSAPDPAACVAACVPNCVASGLATLLPQLGANLGTAVADLRGARYTGQIILANYYSPFTDQNSRQAVQAMNTVIAQAGAAFSLPTADVFSAFDEHTSGPPGFDACAAGLLIPLPTGGCDVHPTQAGAELIAETIAPLVVPRTK